MTFRIQIVLLAGLLPLTCLAQQEPHNTQFMYFKQGYNPGFAGSNASPCISAIYRKQWIGLDGAPENQVLTFNMPLENQRIGIGANASRYSLGITTATTLDLVYAYRIRWGKGMLGLGLQGSVRSLENDFQRTRGIQPIETDPSVPASQESRFLFNFGTGVYYSTEGFYLGASVPRLLANNINFGSDDVVISREVQHFYLMGGFVLPLSAKISLQPQALLKFVNHAPVDVDANLTFIFNDRVYVGGTYRAGGNTENTLGESIDFLLGIQLSRHLFLGTSYDYTLSDLRDFNDGTIEVVLQYCILGKTEEGETQNPRFF